MSGVALVIISDGRGYLAESIPSLIEHADPSWFSAALVVEDGDPTEHSLKAAKMLGDWLGFPVTVKQHGERFGGAAAIQTAQRWALTTGADLMFHIEEDYVYNERIPFTGMASILRNNPNVSTVHLRRGRWGNEGPDGFIGDDPKAHVLHIQSNGDETFTLYLVHDRGFWLQPCLYRTETPREYPWGDHWTEGDYTVPLVRDGYRFAVYGTHEDPPRVTHIGDRRAAAWTW